jgi:hypothetical protein
MYNLRLDLARDLGVDASTKLAIFRAMGTSLMLTPKSVISTNELPRFSNDRA